MKTLRQNIELATLLMLLAAVLGGCGAQGTPAVPQAPSVPTQNVSGPTVPVLSGPVASWQPAGPTTIPWSASYESAEFSVAVRYTVGASAPNSRLVELGGYDSLIGGGFGVEANSGLGYLSCLIWDATGHSPASVLSTIPADGDHTVVCVLGSGVLTMYLDGQEVGNTPATYVFNGHEALGLGTGSSGFWPYAQPIEAVVLWNRALSADEVSGLGQ